MSALVNLLSGISKEHFLQILYTYVGFSSWSLWKVWTNKIPPGKFQNLTIHFNYEPLALYDAPFLVLDNVPTSKVQRWKAEKLKSEINFLMLSNEIQILVKKVWWGKRYSGNAKKKNPSIWLSWICFNIGAHLLNQNTIKIRGRSHRLCFWLKGLCIYITQLKK